MLALRFALLLAVIYELTDGAGIREVMRPFRRTKRAPGGLITIQEFTQNIRGFCKTIRGVTNMLDRYPMSTVGDALYDLPVLVPNIQFFDRLNLIQGVQRTLVGITRSITNLNIMNINSRNLTRDGAKESLNLGSSEFRDDEEYFDPPPEEEPPKTTKKASAPRLLLTMRDVFGLQDVICPSMDFIEGALTRSPISFLRLQRLPLPWRDRANSFNPIKALDIFNLTGIASRILG